MSVADITLGTAPEVKGRSLWADARHRFLRNKAAVTSLVIFCIIALACFLAPHLGLRAPDDINWELESWGPPNLELGYLLGTDANNRDLFVRLLYGGQVSLLVGFTATLVSLVIGVIWGATAGFIGGRVDGFMMRIVDILYSIPFIFFVIMLTVVFGRHITLIYIAIGAVSWLDMARIVRGQTISIRRREYIEAAEASGVSKWRIITRHVIPNCMGPVVVYVTLTVPNVILIESFISFLGMGVQEPDSSWGTLISEAAVVMEIAPWAIIGTGSMLAITLLSLNFIGDGMRDALDPRDR
ncbi:ABC transporter permease subunit [Dongia deserti]|uniref:ABC transporter permease subunit n=1 Tax=Dongia deserti TaxID=2268030 RepID=UPI000E65223E|nr:ABC transporter permease subunit [Dongia deserti]